MLLKDTADMMVSDDYKERFKAEFYQLENRINGLEGMIKKWDEGTLEFKPTCPRGLYDQQLKSMKEYYATLIIRAQIEGIKVDIGNNKS